MLNISLVVEVAVNILYFSGAATSVLDSMNSYVKHFFGCRSCSQHFINMTEDGQNFQHIQTYEVYHTKRAYPVWKGGRPQRERNVDLFFK